jgi:thiamine-phosphate diphosphorylase
VFQSDEAWLQKTREVARHLCACGQSALALRVKEGAESLIAARLTRAREALGPFMRDGLRVLANTSLDRAVALGFSGVHLSRRNTPEAPLERASLPAGFLLGASTHDPASLKHAHALGVDFAVLSPVFSPGSKPGEGMGLTQFATAIKASPLPALALGGVGPQRVASCLKAGARGVAVVSSVMSVSDHSSAIDSFRVTLELEQTIEGASNVI